MTKHPEDSILITKASGEQVPFDRSKLKRSLMRSEATNEEAEEVITEVLGTLVEGMSTKRIYRTAFNLLKKYSNSVAARYKLKSAILELGPSGYPFEHFIAEVFEAKGYRTSVGEIIAGKCVSHEIDVIARKSNHQYLIECKFHNRQHHICDVKVPLYIQSRFIDVKHQWEMMYDEVEDYAAWVVTNTRFSKDATDYANCSGMKALSWDAPIDNGLKDWIDQAGVHPITCLTTLKERETDYLLKQGVVLCRSLLENKRVLDKIGGIKQRRRNQIIKECEALCTHKN